MYCDKKAIIVLYIRINTIKNRSVLKATRLACLKPPAQLARWPPDPLPPSGEIALLKYMSQSKYGDKAHRTVIYHSSDELDQYA